MNPLDDGILPNWPGEVFDALSQFRLGDLIEDPPLPFHGVAAGELWCPSDGSRPKVDGAVESLRAPYGIITTQTCDIVERAPAGQRPFIQISPVFELDDIEQVSSALHLVPLTSKALEGGPWVADLRLETAVEKSILTARTPVRAFRTEDEEIQFGELLGRMRDRAALHDAINAVLYRAWRKRRSNNKNRAKRLFENLHAIGLVVEQGTRLEPIAIQCHFIGASRMVDAEDQEWIEKWWDVASEAAADSEPSLRLLPNVFHDGSQMDLEIYDDLILLEGWLES